MKFKCIESKNKDFIVGEHYESVNIGCKDAFGRRSKKPVFIVGENTYDMECRPFVAFNKRGKVIATFEQIIK